MHDWAEIYLAPWGWLPADASYGVQKSDDPRIADFYCGHQDSYRMIVNLDWGREFFPAQARPCAPSPPTSSAAKSKWTARTSTSTNGTTPRRPNAIWPPARNKAAWRRDPKQSYENASQTQTWLVPPLPVLHTLRQVP